MIKPGKEITEIDIREGIALLRLNDPPANQLTFKMFDVFSGNLNKVFGMQGIRGVIITGSGRHFSSGSDLAELQSQAEFHVCKDHRDTLESIHRSRIPFIAAINGVCLGSAFELALACHFRLATPNALLGLPETTFSLLPGLGGIQYLTSLTGLATSMEVILSGDTFSARSALELGMIDAIAGKSRIIGDAVDFIIKINDRFQPEFRKIYIEKYLSTQHD